MENKENSFTIRSARSTITDKAGFLHKLQELSRDYNTHIICFDADKVAGMRHVQAALIHAMRSFSEGTQISNTIEMESLLYAAGSRQTSIASTFGFHEGENHIYIGCCPEREEVWKSIGSFIELCAEDDPWAEITSEKQANLMKLFDISDKELETIGNCSFVDLVLERVAMLDVYR